MCSNKTSIFIFFIFIGLFETFNVVSDNVVVRDRNILILILFLMSGDRLDVRRSVHHRVNELCVL